MLTIEIETLETGKFQHNGNEHSFATLQGRDGEGKYVRATSYSPFAEALVAALQRSVVSGMDLKESRVVVQLHGDFVTRRKAGYPRPQTYYKFDRFDIQTGPSVVLHRAIKDATIALRLADGSLRADDLRTAYTTLEAFVARFTSQPAPSLDHADMFDPALIVDDADEAADAPDTGAEAAEQKAVVPAEPEDNPEKAAEARLASYDARNAPAGRQETQLKVFGADVPQEEAASDEVPVETVSDEDVPFPEDDAPEAVAAEVVAESPSEPAATEETSNDDTPVEVSTEADAATDEPAQADASEPDAPAASEPTVRRPAFGMRPPQLSGQAKAVAESVTAPAATASDEPASDAAQDEVPAQPARRPPVPRIGLGFRPRG